MAKDKKNVSNSVYRDFIVSFERSHNLKSITKKAVLEQRSKYTGVQ